MTVARWIRELLEDPEATKMALEEVRRDDPTTYALLRTTLTSLAQEPPIEHTVGYSVYCSTGCSCCSYENHRRGPFSSKEAAELAIERYRSIPLLASQYARHGVYEVELHKAEVLPDGRVIIADTLLCPGWCDQTMGLTSRMETDL